MDRASQQRTSEPSCGGSAPSPAATWAFLLHLQEATGDSECPDDLPAAAHYVADDGDAESCSGGDDLCVDVDGAGGRILSWECWMVESANVTMTQTACPTPNDEDTAAAGDHDSDRLFWQACIADGY